MLCHPWDASLAETAALSQKRIRCLEGWKPGEITIRTPQHRDSMVNADRRHPGIMDHATYRLARPDQTLQGLEIARSFSNGPASRRTQPFIHTLQGSPLR